MQWSTSSLIGLGFSIPNIILHGVGTWLLYQVYNKGKLRNSTQILFLMNLAFSEFMKNIFQLVIDLLIVNHYSERSAFSESIFWYVNIFFNSGILYNYILSMFYITSDRLLRIILNLKYQVYCTIGRTKSLIAFTWIMSTLTSFTLTMIYHTVFKSNLIKYLPTLQIYNFYIPAVLLILYILFASITYSSMFLSYAKSQTATNNEQKSQRLYMIFLRSRFFISILLITSFLVLMVIPSLIRSAFFLAKIRISKEFILYCKVSSRMSDLVDAIIYIVLHRNVRKTFLKQVKCKRFSLNVFRHGKQASLIGQLKSDSDENEKLDMNRSSNIAL